MTPPPQIELGFSIEAKAATPALIRQVHGRTIAEITSPHELTRFQSTPPEADGLITFSRGIELFVFTADCLPVLAYSTLPNGPVAALHCGWRGAMQGIITTLREILAEEFTSMHFALGPAIGECCFEVKADFVTAFERAGRPTAPYLSNRKGRLYFNLAEFILCEELGPIPRKNISMEKHRCTVCSNPELPSYRRNGGTDPRIRSWIRKSINPYPTP